MAIPKEIIFVQENRCSDYLVMEVMAIATPSSSSDTQQLDLYLSLSFAIPKESFGEAHSSVELNSGQLELHLTNGKLLDASSLETPECIAQYIPTDPVAHPIWRFSPKVTAHLHGRLDKTYLATVELHGDNPKIALEFKVSAEDVQITHPEGLWPHSITPNQLAVIERKVALLLSEIKLQPYLSRAIWEVEASHLPQILPADSDTPHMAQVRVAIRSLLTASTNNFLELAALANLDVTQDFSGAHLLGVDLSNLDLTGVNLKNAYLRGANLNDTDLSEADLSGANLGGADLSGAYLSNANLYQADLHRASFALANLSGASLQEANLSEANLAQANLSDTDLSEANLTHADLTGARLTLANLTNTQFTGAKVERSHFQATTGLTEAMKRELMQRGAIVEA